MDFCKLWEKRLLDIAEPFLDPKPALIEGSGLAEFADGSTLAVVVNPGAEFPPHSGFIECELVIEYDYEKAQDPDVVSEVWGQILEAFGDGKNGDEPLRTRLASGDLVIPSGIDSVQYERGWINDIGSGINQFFITAYLGITKPT